MQVFDNRQFQFWDSWLLVYHINNEKKNYDDFGR